MATAAVTLKLSTTEFDLIKSVLQRELEELTANVRDESLREKNPEEYRKAGREMLGIEGLLRQMS